MMDFVSFHALVMRLMLLDQHELVETVALPANDPAAWAVFRSDPARWFITADPARHWQLGPLSTDAPPVR